MKKPSGQPSLVFETKPARQSSRKVYSLLLKLTLVPFAAIFGFASVSIFSEAGIPKPIGVLAALALGFLLPWLAWRVAGSMLVFRFELRDDGLHVGTGKWAWSVPYDDVDLIERRLELEHDPYVRVTAGSRRAKVILSPELEEACHSELVYRCECAVWQDAEGMEHVPGAVYFGTGDEAPPEVGAGRSPFRNLLRLKGRRLRSALTWGLVSAAMLALTAFNAWRRVGPAPVKPETAVIVTTLVLGAVFGFASFAHLRMARHWEQECRRLADEGLLGGEQTS